MAEIIIFVMAATLLFCLWMLVDCIYHEKNSSDKSIWFAIIFLVPFFGALVYLLLRYRSNRHKA